MKTIVEYKILPQRDFNTISIIYGLRHFSQVLHSFTSDMRATSEEILRSNGLRYNTFKTRKCSSKLKSENNTYS